MISRYIALALSLLGMTSAGLLAVQMGRPQPPAVTYEPPVKNPFDSSISASGILEAVDENISVGMQETGVIEHIFKNAGDLVTKGEALLILNATELRAELKVKQARVSVAKAKLARLQDQYDRLKSIQDPRAVSVSEVKTKENDVLVATSELEEAEAELAWTEAKLEKMTLRAPKSGIVLQKKAKIGEFLSPSVKDAPFVIGDVSELQVRADIDEQNASWLLPETKAYAYPKNRPELSLPLEFVRIEPYVVPKKSLTGLSDERVDTRVLQVIYKVKPPKEFMLYVGQQVDVFIDRERAS